LVFSPILSHATNLRGQVKGVNQYSSFSYPLGGVTVDLYYQSPQGVQPIGKYITGTDGMFYFNPMYNGRYYLQINGRQNYPVDIFNQNYLDLPPIVLNY
jgi:hypothetical protein